MHDKLINKLTDFIQFERELRSAPDINALGFTAVNYLRRLVKYDVALLLVEKNGRQRVNSISGVSDFDPRAPLVTTCEALCNHPDISVDNTRVHVGDTLPANIAQKFDDIRITQLVSAGLGDGVATLALTREKPWQKHELQLLQQAGEVLEHAIGVFSVQQKVSILKKVSAGLKPNWRWALCGLALVSFVPVPQSIIASAEVTARTPDVVTAGLNGVIEEILVRPNQTVNAGQLLVRFDNTDLTHRKNTLQQELALAEERLRKARQQTLNTTVEKSEFAELVSEIELKRLELNYVNETMNRLEIRADSDGVVLFSRKQDWMGRSVATGEKIMEIAAADDNQFEIWVAANDAIDINAGKPIKFFPDAKPLESVIGEVDSVGFFASRSDTDELAYRIVAEPADGGDTLRLGMKGTARVYGDKVSLAYHVLRKPISAIRKNVGV